MLVYLFHFVIGTKCFYFTVQQNVVVRSPESTSAWYICGWYIYVQSATIALNIKI